MRNAVLTGQLRHLLLGLYPETSTVDIELCMFFDLHSHDQHDYESVGRMRANSQTHLLTGAVEKVISVFYITKMLHLTGWPSSSSSSQMNYLG